VAQVGRPALHTALQYEKHHTRLEHWHYYLPTCLPISHARPYSVATTAPAAPWLLLMLQSLLLLVLFPLAVAAPLPTLMLLHAAAAAAPLLVCC
jgi:hypothetical protein